jgi:hypothetical protein
MPGAVSDDGGGGKGMGRGYLALVLEADLACLHAAVLFEVRPWCVDDGDVVLLVALDGALDKVGV